MERFGWAVGAFAGGVLEDVAVLNRAGELVGVNFDRVWENVANDFGFNPEVARNVAADVRYLLWMLDGIEGEAARPLLNELLGAGTPAAAAKP